MPEDTTEVQCSHCKKYVDNDYFIDTDHRPICDDCYHYAWL